MNFSNDLLKFLLLLRGVSFDNEFELLSSRFVHVKEVEFLSVVGMLEIPRSWDVVYIPPLDVLLLVEVEKVLVLVMSDFCTLLILDRDNLIVRSHSFFMSFSSVTLKFRWSNCLTFLNSSKHQFTILSSSI